MSPIYERPDDYDLEHLEDDDDIEFYSGLIRKLTPSSVVELGCGTGRITIPLAEITAQSGSNIVGIDSSKKMLEKARAHLAEASPRARAHALLLKGDMRTWRAEHAVDLVIVPCASIAHLLTLDDQLQLWRTTYENLGAGGRLVIEVQMPDLSVLAESQTRPARSLTEIDRDIIDADNTSRLLRHKTTSYVCDDQKASVRFLYERFDGDVSVDRYIDDFASHVYFPRELQLLFIHTGFEVESIVGDYRGRALGPSSRLIIMIGRKPDPRGTADK